MLCVFVRNRQRIAACSPAPELRHDNPGFAHMLGLCVSRFCLSQRHDSPDLTGRQGLLMELSHQTINAPKAESAVNWHGAVNRLLSRPISGRRLTGVRFQSEPPRRGYLPRRTMAKNNRAQRARIGYPPAVPNSICNRILPLARRSTKRGPSIVRRNAFCAQRPPVCVNHGICRKRDRVENLNAVHAQICHR